MPGTREAIRLIELTAARLRHDIGSRPEAVQEAPDDTPAAADKAHGPPPTTVLHDGRSGPLPEGRARPASDHQIRRLKLLHAAWGLEERPLSYQALLGLAAGLPEGVTIDPSGLADSCMFPPCIGRIVLNLLLLASDSLPSGGTLLLAGAADDLFLRIIGPAAAWPAGMAACLVDEATACAAITGDLGGLQMPLTALLAHASGVRLSFLMPASGQTVPPILRLGSG